MPMGNKLVRVLIFPAVLFFLVIMYQFPESAGGQWMRTGTCKTAFSARAAEKAEENPAHACVSALIAAPRFEIDGGPGFYREKDPGHCLVWVTGPARVEFSAAPLHSMTGGKKGKLNVVYWVDWPEKKGWSFRPGGPPLVLPVTGETQRFNIYGGVTINEISEQPAGNYRGSITVTVIWQ